MNKQKYLEEIENLKKQLKKANEQNLEYQKKLYDYQNPQSQKLKFENSIKVETNFHDYKPTLHQKEKEKTLVGSSYLCREYLLPIFPRPESSFISQTILERKFYSSTKVQEWKTEDHLLYHLENEELSPQLLSVIFTYWKESNERVESIVREKTEFASVRRLWFWFEFFTKQKIDFEIKQDNDLMKKENLPLLVPSALQLFEKKEKRYKLLRNLPLATNCLLFISKEKTEESKINIDSIIGKKREINNFSEAISNRNSKSSHKIEDLKITDERAKEIVEIRNKNFNFSKIDHRNYINYFNIDKWSSFVEESFNHHIRSKRNEEEEVITKEKKKKIYEGVYSNIKIEEEIVHYGCPAERVENVLKALFEYIKDILFNYNSAFKNNVVNYFGAIASFYCNVHPTKDANGRLSRIIFELLIKSRLDVFLPISLIIWYNISEKSYINRYTESYSKYSDNLIQTLESIKAIKRCETGYRFTWNSDISIDLITNLYCFYDATKCANSWRYYFDCSVRSVIWEKCLVDITKEKINLEDKREKNFFSKTILKYKSPFILKGELENFDISKKTKNKMNDEEKEKFCKIGNELIESISEHYKFFKR